MEDVPAFGVILAVLGAMALVLWLANRSEKMGVDSRPWRMTWLAIILGGALAVYLILVNK